MQKTSEVYDKLYHYTTFDGLIGILQTQSLWATHYKFLNDFSEIILFRDKLISLMYPHILESIEEIIKQSPQIKQNVDEIGGLKHVELNRSRGNYTSSSHTRVLLFLFL